MNTNEDIGEFQGVEINFATEYHAARKMMGLKTTNLDDLFYNVGLLYVNTPTKWAEHYHMLLDEITTRQDLLSRLKK